MELPGSANRIFWSGDLLGGAKLTLSRCASQSRTAKFRLHNKLRNSCMYTCTCTLSTYWAASLERDLGDLGSEADDAKQWARVLLKFF